MKTAQDLLKIIQEQGSRKSLRYSKDHSILCGMMTSGNTCEVEGLGEFQADELLFLEIMTRQTLTNLDFKIKKGGGETHSHDWEDKSDYLKPLKKGDIVAMVPFCDKYLVIGRVVEL